MSPEEVKIGLLKRIIAAFNELDAGELESVLYGIWGNFNLNQSSPLTNHQTGAFQLCDASCICGNIDNAPCQWLASGEKCNGKYCHNYDNGRTAPKTGGRR